MLKAGGFCPFFFPLKSHEYVASLIFLFTTLFFCHLLLCSCVHACCSVMRDVINTFHKYALNCCVCVCVVYCPCDEGRVGNVLDR